MYPSQTRTYSLKVTIMEGSRLIHRLQLVSFLSYGSEGAAIDLQPLNVLIGPNASGKSNLIEALNLIGATPTDLVAYFREGGGVAEYIWKKGALDAPAVVRATVEYPKSAISRPLEYLIGFSQVGQRPDLAFEYLGPKRPDSDDSADTDVLYVSTHGRAYIAPRTGGDQVLALAVQVQSSVRIH
jgi:predicted ATPase